MAKFLVRVEVVATCNYTVEVEAADWSEANDAATTRAIYAANSPEDFQVAADYCDIQADDTEQLTAVCPGCGVEHLYPENPSLTMCHCGQFGHHPYAGTPENPDGRAPIRPHLNVNSRCIPAPWWHEDNEYCASCGAKIESGEMEP